MKFILSEGAILMRDLFLWITFNVFDCISGIISLRIHIGLNARNLKVGAIEF